MRWQRKWSDEEVATVAALMIDKKSAAQIGQRFGLTRNAIIGRIHRCPELKAIGLNGSHPLYGNRKPRERKARTKLARVVPVVSTTLPMTSPEPAEARFVRLVDLARHECKWPVNDAAPGEQHLFCGLPSVGSYCTHHNLRSINQRVPS